MDWLDVNLSGFFQQYGVLIVISIQVVALGWSIYKGIRDHERTHTRCGQCGHIRVSSRRSSDDNGNRDGLD